MDDVTVSFRSDTAHFALIYPDALERLPISNLRKLFNLMLTDPLFRNEKAIRMTHEALRTFSAETKAAWDAASVEFQRGYVDPKYHNCYDKQRIAANNKKLTAAVKSSKAAHERARKLLTYFEEIKAKYDQ